MNDVDLVELTTQLIVISHLRQHDKLSVDGETLRIDPAGHFQPLKRFVAGDNRERSLIMVQGVVRDMCKRIRCISVGTCTSSETSQEHDTIKLERTQIVHRGMEALTNAMSGLKNLEVTYNHDARAVAVLQHLIIEIYDFLTTFNPDKDEVP